jgi:hypothetical protein
MQYAPTLGHLANSKNSFAPPLREEKISTLGEVVEQLSDSEPRPSALARSATDRKSARGPLLEFHEVTAIPAKRDRCTGDNSFRVNAKNQLSQSLLQARLIDLNKPIKIVQGT